MATMPLTVVKAAGGNVFTWSLTADGDLGEGMAPMGTGLLAASVQVAGTVSNLVMEQSNNGVTFHPLLDIYGDPLVFTAAGMKDLSASARIIRPRLVTGTSVVVSLFFRGER